MTTRIRLIELNNGNKTYVAEYKASGLGWLELPWQFNHTLKDAKAAIDIFIAGQVKNETFLSYP